MGPGRSGSAWRWVGRHVWGFVRAVLKYLLNGAKHIGFGYFPVHSSFLCPEPEPPVLEQEPGEAETPLQPAELRAWRDLEKVLRND